MASRLVPEGGWGSRLKPLKTPREHSQGHLAFIRKLPCICCLVGGIVLVALSCDPAHLRAGSLLHGKEPAGKAEKPHDRWTLPLCRQHHDRQHSMAELNFWKQYGVDPFLLALILWSLTGREHDAIEVLKLHARGNA